MAKLTIIRGLPGAGKTTHAKKLIEEMGEYCNTQHYEADLYFNKWPSYTFDSRLLEAAHDWCYSNVVRALWFGEDCIVSNTFTQMWEMDRYMAIPTIVDNVQIEVIEMHTRFQNIHGCPEDKVSMMAARWESIPQEWIDDGLKVEIVK